MFPMTLFENFLSRRIAFPAVVLVLVLTAACGRAPGDAVDAGCSGLEVLPNRAGLVNRRRSGGVGNRTACNARSGGFGNRNREGCGLVA